MTQIKSFLTIVLLLCLVACGDDGMRVVANFANTQQFEVGKPVYFNDQIVGEIQSINQGETGAQVTLSLQPEAAGELNSSVAAVVNRLKEGAPLELYNRSSGAAELLQDGQTIKGLDSMVQLGAWMLGDAIQVGSGSLSDYVQSFQDYLSSDEFEQDKAAVKQQFDSAREQANSAMERLGSELNATADALVETEKAAAQAMQELGEELAPVVEDLAGDGARLAEELQKFAESLEQQNSQERQAGEAFLASLLTTLERLNEALESGNNLEEPEADSEIQAGEEQ